MKMTIKKMQKTRMQQIRKQTTEKIMNKKKNPPIEPPKIAPMLDDDAAEVQTELSAERTPLQVSHAELMLLKYCDDGQDLQFLLSTLTPLHKTQELLDDARKMLLPGQGWQEVGELQIPSHKTHVCTEAS